MFTKKKTGGVCGYRVTPTKEEIYVAEEPRGFMDALTKPPMRFSAMDCPRCGCQIPLAIRVPRVDLPTIRSGTAPTKARWRKLKIKNIAAICKKNKYAVIYERNTESGGVVQYIGDGAAAYPVTGLPALDKESLLTIFDVPEKQREDWFVQVAGIPSEISFDDMDATEKPVEREAISIAYSGKTLKPLQTRRGLVFIESRYLSPVSDILDVLELYERITPGGTPYIVAKAGFLLQAVIMPYDVISQQFVDNLKRLTEQCALSLDLREREKALARAAEPEQFSLNVDPATGEIVEDESEVADNA